MRTNFNLVLGIAILLLIPQTRVFAEGTHKPRVIITTDGEIDDKTSFVRFLLYANEFD